MTLTPRKTYRSKPINVLIESILLFYFMDHFRTVLVQKMGLFKIAPGAVFEKSGHSGIFSRISE
jgi:hypothetical protein